MQCTEVVSIWKEAKLPSDREVGRRLRRMSGGVTNSRVPNIKHVYTSVHMCNCRGVGAL
jgi:hypothetical protein